MADLSADAAALMNNEAFKAAIESAQRDCINAAMTCDPKDDDGRRRFLDAAKTAAKVVAHLQALIVATGTGEVVDPDKFYEERAKRRFAFLSK